MAVCARQKGLQKHVHRLTGCFAAVSEQPVIADDAVVFPIPPVDKFLVGASSRPTANIGTTCCAKMCGDSLGERGRIGVQAADFRAQTYPQL